MIFFLRVLLLLFLGFFLFKRIRSILSSLSRQTPGSGDSHRSSDSYKSTYKRNSDSEGGQTEDFNRDSPRGGNSQAKKDPYQVLGVHRSSPSEDIHKAYRKLMSQYHPDKVAHLGFDLQKLAKERSQEITEAYQAIKKERPREEKPRKERGREENLNL